MDVVGYLIIKNFSTKKLRRMNLNALIEGFTSELGHNLEIHLSAMNHILYGDLTDRVHRNTGVKLVEKILKGGLHTVNGWKKFAQEHPSLVHISDFDSTLHSSWYYARELQNGVITLKLPRHLYNNKAAKITKFPDDYYKSGYLWKTLFPEKFGEKEILNTIHEVLNNIDIEASSEGEIVGYSQIDDQLKTMRVVILYRDNVINSVFPSWSQPNTGNNGKSFSHFDNIGHVINAATVYFDIMSKNDAVSVSFMDKNNVTKSLVNNTPSVFLVRSKPKNNIESWKKKRDIYLIKTSKTLNEKDVNIIYEYIVDFEICKNHDSICKYGYATDIHQIETSLQVYNAYQIHQNLVDALLILHTYDVLKNTNHFQKSIAYLLKNMVTSVGIDFWVKRRVLNRIITLLTSYNNTEAAIEFINLFSESPSRREILVEFSLDSQVRKDLKGPLDEMPTELEIIQNPSLSVKLEVRHFVEYIKENLGENYALHFNDKVRTAFAIQLIKSGGANYQLLISDVVRYCDKSDFISFSEKFEEFINYIVSNNATEGTEDSIHRIMRDYCRIQFGQRLRYNLIYKDYANFEFDEFFPITDDFIKNTILRHERFLNTLRIKMFLDAVERLVQFFHDSTLAEEISKYREKAGKEVPPPPNPIPKYIDERRNA